MLGCWGTWPIDSLAAGITCYLSRQIRRLPDRRVIWKLFLGDLSGLSAVHFDPNYMSCSCTFAHCLVFSISNWSGVGRIDGRTGKGCHVVRLGRIDQLPRAHESDCASHLRAPNVERHVWHLTGTRNAIWEPPEMQITTLNCGSVRNDLSANSELS